MKAYVTKFALTKGILLKNGYVKGAYFYSDEKWGGVYRLSEWQHSFLYARERAESMRLKKIASLKKQIAKLEALDFNTMPVPYDSNDIEPTPKRQPGGEV